MTSFASIDRIEDDYAVCEVELEETVNSSKIDFCEMETEMIDIELQWINSVVGEVEEGDILIVEHDGQRVTWIYGKADCEKTRRQDAIRELFNQD